MNGVHGAGTVRHIRTPPNVLWTELTRVPPKPNHSPISIPRFAYFYQPPKNIVMAARGKEIRIAYDPHPPSRSSLSKMVFTE